MQVKVNESIPGTISFENFRFSLLKCEFEFKDMLLKGPSNDELAGFVAFLSSLPGFRFLEGSLRSQI
jgi:hypothetical protein